jgi:hypothetical protein
MPYITEYAVNWSLNEGGDVQPPTGIGLVLANSGANVAGPVPASFVVNGNTASLASPVRFPAASSAYSFNTVRVVDSSNNVLGFAMVSAQAVNVGDEPVVNALTITLNAAGSNTVANKTLRCIFAGASPAVEFPDVADSPRDLNVRAVGEMGISPYNEGQVRFVGGVSQASVSFGPVSFDFTVNYLVIGPNSRFVALLSPAVFVPATKRLVVDLIRAV